MKKYVILMVIVSTALLSACNKHSPQQKFNTICKAMMQTAKDVKNQIKQTAANNKDNNNPMTAIDETTKMMSLMQKKIVKPYGQWYQVCFAGMNHPTKADCTSTHLVRNPKCLQATEVTYKKLYGK